MWQILLILQPAGNGGPGGEDGVWEKEDGARRNLFGKSCIEPAGKFQAGAKCDGWRVAEERWGQGRVMAPLISYPGHDPAKCRQE